MPVEMNAFFLPILTMFAVIEWLFFFMETYRHFPKMEKKKRIRDSVIEATIMTIVISGILYFFMYMILQITGF